MKVGLTYRDYGIMVLEDVFSQDEHERIFEDLEWIYEGGLLLGPESTASAKNDDGSFKKKNAGVFLNEIHLPEGKTLEVDRIAQERLLSLEARESYAQLHPLCSSILNVNRFGSLLSYYENGDCYDDHTDECVFTVISYFYKEPKAFRGGELVFTVSGQKMSVGVENNTAVIFPAACHHEVTEVEMLDDTTKMGGRFALSHFLYVAPY